MALDIHKKASDNVEAIGAGGTIKKQNYAQLKLKLLKLPELGKLETQLTNGCHAAMRLVEMEDQLTNECSMTKRLVEIGLQDWLKCARSKPGKLVAVEIVLWLWN